MSAATVHIACLCAAWCRLCADYRAVFDAACAELGVATDAGVATATAADAPVLSARWIDIEDQAELVGDYDVETFPTLVVADAQAVRFAGALPPQPDQLRRLLRATLTDADPATRWPAVAAEVADFAARLRAAA